MVIESLTQRLRRIWFTLVILLCIMIIATSGVGIGRSQVPSENPTNPYVISLESNSSWNVTVLNKNGGLVSNLDKSNFEIDEDHIPQEIRVFQHGDVPVTVGLVIDSSSSMRPMRSEVIAAAMAFVEMINSQDQIFIVSFNEHPKLELPLGKLFSNEAGELRVALNQSIPAGQTAFYDALVLAFDHLNKGKHEKQGHFSLSATVGTMPANIGLIRFLRWHKNPRRLSIQSHWFPRKTGNKIPKCSRDSQIFQGESFSLLPQFRKFRLFVVVSLMIFATSIL